MSDAVIGGRYRLVERLASGGMGSVWKAHDERLDRTVAVKQVHLQPGLPPHDAELAAQRALREARNAARLHHPNAVQVYDVVDDDGGPSLVLQYVPSTSLQQIVRTQGPRGVTEVARIGTQVAAALAAAHRAGIVHRDVKPGNILIDDEGTARITDFGISHAHNDPSLTATGLLTGTPAYLAPEVARGAPSTPASDVFSLASTLFMAAEGTPPFGTDQNAIAVLHRVASGDVAPARHLGALEPLLRQMMSPDPAARPDMVSVANSLAGLATGSASAGTGPAAATRPTPTVLAAAPTTALPRRTPMVVVPPPYPPDHSPGYAADGPLPLTDGPVRRERQPSVLVPFLAAACVVALGTVLAVVLIRSGTSGNDAAAPADPAPVTRSTTQSQPTQSATTRSSSPVARTTAKPKPTATAKPTTKPKPTAKPTTKPKPTAKPRPNGGAPTARELAQAITDYYSLVPGNTEAGWQLLTEKYRRTTAQGRARYEQFWGSMRRVRISNVDAEPPNVVVATLTYYPDKGPRAVNRTRFALVRDGGRLKIDASRVI